MIEDFSIRLILCCNVYFFLLFELVWNSYSYSYFLLLFILNIDEELQVIIFL
jgi:hypothetical protein